MILSIVFKILFMYHRFDKLYVIILYKKSIFFFIYIPFSTVCNIIYVGINVSNCLPATLV